MNQKFFGDSFDLAKRFICGALTDLGYDVMIDPMFTDGWNAEQENDFFKLIGANPIHTTSHPTTLFLDPDTGIRKLGGKRHVSFDRMVAELKNHELVFAFDQAFSFQAIRSSVMREKLTAIRDRGCHGLYYNSHAKFLFIAQAPEKLTALSSKLHELGLPMSRLLQLAPNNTLEPTLSTHKPRGQRGSA